jgi:hypothetical protein
MISSSFPPVLVYHHTSLKTTGYDFATLSGPSTRPVAPLSQVEDADMLDEVVFKACLLLSHVITDNERIDSFPAGQSKVLRSLLDVLWVGKQFKNCAASFVKDIEEER